MNNHAESLRAMIAAWVRQDVDAVMGFLHDDITWHNSGGSRPPIEGKAAVRGAMETMRDNIVETRWRLFECAQVGDTVWMEGVDEFIRKNGTRIAIPYAGLLQFEDGLIRHWREYYDSKLIDQAEAGDGVPASVDALLARPTV
jgi:limonene-1,2-epoxide hydrolase